MKLTRNLWIYIIINLLSTIGFITLLKNGVLTTGVSENTASYVSWLPLVYAGVWFFSGLILGYFDKPRKTRYNIDFMYS